MSLVAGTRPGSGEHALTRATGVAVVVLAAGVLLGASPRPHGLLAYLLRYSAHGVAPEGWHAITVRMNRPGNYTILARRGYFGAATGRWPRE